MDTTTATTTCTETPPAEKHDQRKLLFAGRSRYNIRERPIAPIKMEIGDSIYFTSSESPKSRFIMAGEHYDWIGPYPGRAGDDGSYSRETMEAHKLTAKRPLLLALHNPWEDNRGAAKCGHIRLARPTHHPFRLCREMPERLQSFDDLRLACYRDQRHEHIIAGGPEGAIIYIDECVVPAYKYEPETKNLTPYTYIIGEDEIDSLMDTYRRVGQERSELRKGILPKVVVGKNGSLVTLYRGARSANFPDGDEIYQIDQVGRVYGLTIRGVSRNLVSKGGVAVARLHELITNLEFRRSLGLDAGVTIESTVVTNHPPGASSLNGLERAFAEIDNLPKAVEAPTRRAIPKALRAHKVPKLADLEIQLEVPPTVHPPEALEMARLEHMEADSMIIPEIPEQQPLLPQELPEGPAPLTQEGLVQLRAEMLLEEKGKAPMPEIVDALGNIRVERGTPLSLEIARSLLSDPSNVWVTPEAEKFLEDFYVLCDL